MAKFWIGTSGWHYKHWRGNFYPEGLPTSKWLEFYSREFPTVEINASFYRQPANTTWQNWRKTVPDGFCFAVKASRFVTHIRRLQDPQDSLERVLEGSRRLGDRLGPILYQLPPYFERNEYTLADLEQFLEILPRSEKHVIEFRHPSWFEDETAALLKRHDIAFCSFDMPKMECPLWLTAPFGYMRFHGTKEQYASNYSEKLLKEWAARLRKLAHGAEAMYVYFNNDAHGHAVQNARRLRELLHA